MNLFLKNLGVLIILVAVFLLTYYMLKTPIENTLLIVAGLLLLVGLGAHITLNRLVE